MRWARRRRAQVGRDPEEPLMSRHRPCRSSWSQPTGSCGRARPRWSSPAPPRATSASCRTTRRCCRCWSTASCDVTTGRRRDLDRGRRRRLHLGGRQPDLDPRRARRDVARHRPRAGPRRPRAGARGGRATTRRTRPRAAWAEARIRAVEHRPEQRRAVADAAVDAAVAVGRRRGRRPVLLLVLLYGLCWWSAAGGSPATAAPSSSAVRVRSDQGRARLGSRASVATPATQLELFRIFSLVAAADAGPRPRRPRVRRPAGAGGAEAHSLYAGHVDRRVPDAGRAVRAGDEPLTRSPGSWPGSRPPRPAAGVAGSDPRAKVTARRRAPEHVAAGAVGVAGKDEEQVAEPVEVA